jgi:hypothetical protein
MAQLDLIANSLTSNFEMLKEHLAEFTDAEMLVRPVPNANHAAWQVGHLAVLEAMLCGMYVPEKAPKMPADAEKTYGREGASSDDASRFFKKEEGLKILGQARGALVEWVKTMSEADLAKPAPEWCKGWVATIGELLLGIIGHTTMHVGQIQVIRRKLGKKILF